MYIIFKYIVNLNIMGAGILPYAIYKNQIFYLISRESEDVVWKESGLWSEFGGAAEKDETLKDAAIREAYEESNKLLGTTEQITQLINQPTTKYITLNKHRVYLVKMKYDEKLPTKFRNKYLYMKNNNPEYLKDTKLKYFYEKDKIKWITMDEMKKNLKIFRPWFVKYLPLIKYRLKGTLETN